MTANGQKVLMAGFNAGGHTGFAQPEQIASVRAALKMAEVPEAAIDTAVGYIKDAGILNASATRQFLVRQGLLAEKIDPKIQAALKAMLE